MVHYFDQLLLQENPLHADDNVAKLWAEKLNSKTFKYWIKKEKTNLITMRMEIKYVKKFEMDKIAQFMFEPHHKLLWDKNIEEMSYTQSHTDSINVGRLYYKNKKQLALDSRDYDEKVFTIWHGSKLYRFSSSCYDPNPAPSTSASSSPPTLSCFYPTRPNTVRADTLYSLMTVERDASDDDKIKITYLCSIDFMTSIPMAIVDPFMAKATQSWFSEF